MWVTRAGGDLLLEGRRVLRASRLDVTVVVLGVQACGFTREAFLRPATRDSAGHPTGSTGDSSSGRGHEQAMEEPPQEWTGASALAHTPRAVVHERGGQRLESERLARLCFEAGRDPDFPRRFRELLHPDVTVALKSTEGDWLHGATAVEELLDERATAPVYEATDEQYHAIDDERVVVEGRLRWMDDDRTLRDDPAIWAIEFRDGLLYRSIAVRSLAEAEAVLSAGRSSDD